MASFDCDWPYDKPVFVLSTTLHAVDEEYKDKVFLINGDLDNILVELHNKGFKNLYIDGGITIQNFLKKDLIDELIITTIPILLGGGISLFGKLTAPLNFKHISSHKYLDTMVQNHFVRTR